MKSEMVDSRPDPSVSGMAPLVLVMAISLAGNFVSLIAADFVFGSTAGTFAGIASITIAAISAIVTREGMTFRHREKMRSLALEEKRIGLDEGRLQLQIDGLKFQHQLAKKQIPTRVSTDSLNIEFGEKSQVTSGIHS